MVDPGRVVPMRGSPDAKLLAELMQRDGRAEDAKRGYETAVKENLAYLAGIQWIDRHPQTGKMVDVSALPSPSWRVRDTINRIKPIYEGMLGRFMLQSLEPSAEAVGQDAEDLAAARAADKLLRWLFHRVGETTQQDGFAHQVQDFFGWLLSAGTVFLHWWWDPDAEAESRFGYAEGDVCFTVESPLDVYPDPDVQDWRHCRWVIRHVLRPRSFVRARWPDKVDKVKDEALQPKIPLPGATSPSTAGLWQAPRELQGMVMLREYWEAPNDDFPNGRYAVFAPGALLEYREALPYGRKLPFVKVDFIRLPGAFWGMSLIHPLKSPQRHYNQLRSRVKEHVRLVAAGKLLVPVTAGLDARAWTSQPGEKIVYQGPVPPQYVQIPPLPKDVDEEIDRIERDMEVIAQLRSFGLDLEGSGKRTALEAMLQQQLEDMSRAPFFASLDAALRRFWTDVLELCKERYVEPRLIRVGVGSDADVDEILGTDLEGAYHVQVSIRRDGGFTRTERLQVAQMLMQIGVFGGQDDPKRIERFLRFTELEDLANFDIADAEVENAEQENAGMERGVQYQVGLLDNHAVHLAIHVDKLKRLGLDPTTPEDVLSRFEMHIAQHEQVMKASQGPPPAAPPSPQPPQPQGQPPQGGI